MGIYAISIIAGLAYWLAGIWFGADTAGEYARAADRARDMGPTLAGAALAFWFIDHKSQKRGVAAVRLAVLRYMVGYWLIHITLTVVEKAVPVRPPHRYLKPSVIFDYAFLIGLIAWVLWARAWKVERLVTEHPDDYCHECGYRLLPDQERCPECGRKVRG